MRKSRADAEAGETTRVLDRVRGGRLAACVVSRREMPPPYLGSYSLLILCDAEKVWAGADEHAAIRDRGGGVAEVAQVIRGQRAKLLRVCLEHGREPLVVGRVNAITGQDQ